MMDLLGSVYSRARQLTQIAGQQLLHVAMAARLAVTHNRDQQVREIRAAFSPIRLNIGSGGLCYPGWISSDVAGGPRYLPTASALEQCPLQLDVTRQEHWHAAFDEGSIANMLSEHVFEHLSDAQIERALDLAYRYLAPGGRFRIAVPDGNRPDTRYLEGIRPPADGHLQLFTIDDLSRRLGQHGFQVEPIEWYDTSGIFHRRAYDERDGIVLRCYARDRQADFAYADHFYTSIIVDAVKGEA